MTDAVETNPARKLGKGWTIAGSVLLVILGLWFLLVSSDPSVDLQPPPTAQSVKKAREAIRQLRDTRGTASGRILIDNSMLAGLSALAGDVSGTTRLKAQIASKRLVVAMSISLPGNQWLNISAIVAGQFDGFPALQLSVGRLKLPLWAGRPLAEVARWALRAMGADVPPLDTMVRTLSVTEGELSTEITLPARTGIVDRVIAARGDGVDDKLVAQIYCRLTSSQAASPADRLVVQLQRGFVGAPAGGSVTYNRAALVAIAFLVVGERAQALAPDAAGQARRCNRAGPTILLADRSDLAKHWALSAALGAVLGDAAGSALGEWKELADSLPSGSGFSFMDLAADRSGLRLARRAVSPATAASTASELARVTEEQLFPISLIAAQEGLSEREFIERYGNVDADKYRATVRWIDRELNKAGAN